MACRFVSLGLAVVILTGPAGAQQRTFEGPRHEGMDVGYCGATPAACGESVAMAWCRAQGYERATDWAARAGNPVSRSVRLEDGAICEGPTCESFARITCGGSRQTLPVPVLGAAAQATVLSPDLRSTATLLDDSEYRVMMPGCAQQAPGVFMCKSLLEYQHCRTLMVGSLVFSCRAGLAFDGVPAEPRVAADSEYVLELESDAEVRVSFGDRGGGQVRGKAVLELSLAPPLEETGAWCLERASYVYHPTGPDGGTAEIGEPAACDAPIGYRFEPSQDDLIRAYDLCESFSAWGSAIDEQIEVLVAALFEVRSASPAFHAAHGADGAVIAPYVHIKAPLAVDCRY